LYPVRTSFTQGTTNGTLVPLSGNIGKKRTSHPTTGVVSYICTTTGITGDTATGEDTQPHATAVFDLPAAIGTVPTVGNWEMAYQSTSQYPLILAPTEGFRIKNDIAFAATGVSNLIVNLEYDEITTY
jgi:hypothetical protein